MHYLLFYEKVKDYAETQIALQEAHRDYVVEEARKGEIILAGNLGDAADAAALILFKCDSPSTVDMFAKRDPYVMHGVVSKWYVKPWETVIGVDAAHPLEQ